MTTQIVPELPGGTIYPYQAEAVAFISQHKGRALIADDVGLGKTVEALAWLYTMPGLRPALIICPASVKLQWEREIKRWLHLVPEEIALLSGTQPSLWMLGESKKVAIINYDILANWLKVLQLWGPKVLVYDELQYLKESKNKRSRAARTLSNTRTIQSVIGLTGTPILNRPKELWHPSQIINPTIFPNWFRFASRYCNPQRRNTTAQRGADGKVLKNDDGTPVWNQSWDFSGASNLDELERITKNRFLIRRRKVDVIHDLPEKTRVTIPFNCNLSAYLESETRIREEFRQKNIKQVLRKYREELEALPEAERKKALADRAEANSTFKLYGYAIQMITALKKEAAYAKFSSSIEWILDFMENGEPLVIFAHHHEFLDLTAHQIQDKGFNVPRVLDGRLPLAKRQDYALRFGQGEFNAIVCGITAMGTGVDGLQHGASNMVFLELGWNPAHHEQAEGRLFRVGQKNAVTSYYLVAEGTIEEDIARLIDAKATVTSALVGEMDEAGIIESIIEMLSS